MKKLVFICALILLSCNYYTHSSVEGELKKINRFRQLPKWSTSYTRIGKEIVTDTIKNYTVSKKCYKHKVEDLYGSYTIREKMISYNSKHDITKKVILHKNKQKRIEYYESGTKKTIKTKRLILNDTTGIYIIKIKSFNPKGKLIKIEIDTSYVSIRSKF